ncbi:tonB-system energizer ExbB [Lacibacterium aquatile]|uniref:Biopolymer transport protein ExbB n=1 Tax=Lacibacterium aquatile TaxID=1168082 RepID=A0ABW5DXI9_9PROT
MRFLLTCLLLFPTLVFAQAPAAETLAIPTGMTHDLSPMGMFLAADWVVKAVMIGLALASVATWTVWLAKSWELSSARKDLRAGLDVLLRARTLAEAGSKPTKGIVSRLVKVAAAEAEASGSGTGEGLKERVSSHLDRLVQATGRRMTRGTGLLATIGSIGPFVGLFGTVWGIMNSFIGISKSQTTNLAVVAPGIAEALLATAIGLVAAIPAVIIYNVFARAIAGYKAECLDAAAAVERLISRDLDRRISPAPLTRAAE